MRRIVLAWCASLWIMGGCAPSEPPILVFRDTPMPETVIREQGPAIHAEPGTIPPQQGSAVPDFTTRVRIFNEYNTVTFDIWIDPTEFDGEGNPTGKPFRLFPLLDPNFANLRERTFRLAPGPHRLYFRSFYATDYHGARPRPGGWYSFWVAHRDDPCSICLQIGTRQFGF